MVSLDTPQRMGGRALAYMIVSKLKYPSVCVLIMIIVSVLLYVSRDTLTLWQTGESSMLKTIAAILSAFFMYGWFFTAAFALFLSLTAIPEYLGRAIWLGKDAFFVRTGLLSHREIAIPYRQIQTINIVNKTLPGLFGLSSVYVVTSAEHDGTEDGAGSQATLPYVHRSLARTLRDLLLLRSNSAQGTSTPCN